MKRRSQRGNNDGGRQCGKCGRLFPLPSKHFVQCEEYELAAAIAIAANGQSVVVGNRIEGTFDISDRPFGCQVIIVGVTIPKGAGIIVRRILR